MKKWKLGGLTFQTSTLRHSILGWQSFVTARNTSEPDRPMSELYKGRSIDQPTAQQQADNWLNGKYPGVRQVRD